MHRHHPPILNNYSQSRRPVLSPAELEIIRIRAARGIPAPIPGKVTPAPAGRMPASRYEQMEAARFGTPGRVNTAQDAAALDHAARAYQAAHPGCGYIDAVKAVQYLG
jgi:hypothetical protein